MKIGLFTDTHYCDAELLEQDRRPRRAYEALKVAFDDFKNSGVEAVVCLGDIIHYYNGFDESKKCLEKISTLINSYGIPTYLCLGNHDNEVMSAEDFEKITGFTVAPCTVDHGEVRMIFLDASYYPDGTPYGRVDVDWTSSYVPKNQLEQLKEKLKTDKKCIVFIHQNLDTNVEKHHIVSNADEVNRIIADGKAAHVYQGHYHYGAENIINGVPYTTVRAMTIGEEKNYLIIEA